VELVAQRLLAQALRLSANAAAARIVMVLIITGLICCKLSGLFRTTEPPVAMFFKGKPDVFVVSGRRLAGFDDFDLNSGGHLLKKGCNIPISHPDTSVAAWLPNQLLVVGSMNVDVAVPGVGVALFEALKPENAGDDEVIGAPGAFEGDDFPRGDPAFEDHPERGFVTDHLGNGEMAQGGLEASRLRPEPETGAGDRKTRQKRPLFEEVEALRGNIYPDFAWERLHGCRLVI